MKIDNSNHLKQQIAFMFDIFDIPNETFKKLILKIEEMMVKLGKRIYTRILNKSMGISLKKDGSGVVGVLEG